MTFLHFVNCVALTFVPSYIIYKATRLGEFRALAVCMWGGLAYVITQLAKMIFLATFLPTSEVHYDFDFTTELVRTLVNIGDLIGAHFALNAAGGSYEGDMKILGTGLGWATAESVFVRLAPLWIGARTLEFSWNYIQTSLEANINLLLHISFVTFVWLWSRKKLQRKLLPFVYAGIIIYSVLPFVANYMQSVLHLGAWTVLVFHLAATALLTASARLLYSAFSASLSAPQK